MRFSRERGWRYPVVGREREGAAIGGRRTYPSRGAAHSIDMRLPPLVAMGLGAGCSLVVLGCGAVAGAPAARTTPASLHDRPLRLPSVRAGAPCPTSPEVRVPPGPGGVYAKAIPAYAFGAGPAYLSGQIRWYAGPPGQAALVLIDGTYTGPMLIRVRRIDGSGRVTLADLGIPPEHRLPTMLPPGTNTGDGVEVAVPPGTSGWSEWEGRLTADAPGCDALQVDGSNFTSVVVFTVRPGPIPPD
jgi:hypothetical protein